MNLAVLVDAQYLPHAIVLYDSLRQTGAAFNLVAICADEISAAVLDNLRQDNLRVMELREVEASDPGLLAVKKGRSRAEYCWTAVPSVCLHLLNQGLDSLTFVDADLRFFTDPAVLAEQSRGASIVIVPHGFQRSWRSHASWAGRYNCGYLFFRGDAAGFAALRWWRERCLEWCYDRAEPDRFSNQRYLDDWPERFDGVHVVGHPGAGLAPWNDARFKLDRSEGRLRVEGQPLVFYHFQSAAIRRAGAVTGHWPVNRTHLVDCRGLVITRRHLVPSRVEEWLWQPYLAELAAATQGVLDGSPGYARYFPRDTLPAALRQVANHAHLIGYETLGGLLPQRVRPWLSPATRPD